MVGSIPYSSDFALNVYYPEESGEWPVAVVFHGGEVTANSMAVYASQVAESGVVVFVPEFSSTPAQLAEALHSGAEDGVCAMRYARAHASDFGGSSERVVTAGLSYGAVVAALMTLAADQFEGDCVEADELSAFADGFVGLDGLYDFVELPGVLGFQDRYTIEELEKASVSTYVAAPPIEGVRFQLFTGSDPVAQEQTELFRTLLDTVGYQVEVLARPDVAHSVMFPTQAEGAVQALVEMASG
jgi:acetyl esterase/lipase